MTPIITEAQLAKAWFEEGLEVKDLPARFDVNMFVIQSHARKYDFPWRRHLMSGWKSRLSCLWADPAISIEQVAARLCTTPKAVWCMVGYHGIYGLTPRRKREKET